MSTIMTLQDMHSGKRTKAKKAKAKKAKRAKKAEAKIPHGGESY